MHPALFRSLIGSAFALAALAAPAQPLPRHLRDTGWGGPQALAYTPVYALWSDDATKRRWLALPAGRFIDARDPDAWQFPPGTRLWKEFAVDGRRIETRYITRTAGGRWQFASYLWNEDGSDAELAPAGGATVATSRGAYTVPAREDCRACHESAAVPVLGAGTLQLSPARDPLAANAQPPAAGDADLPALVRRGWLRGLPPALLAQPPRIEAGSDIERAALGTLHTNCGHCHNASGRGVPLPFSLAWTTRAPAPAAALPGQPARWRPPPGSAALQLLAPGDSAASALVQRMQSRQPAVQMPPLGTAHPDAEGLALVRRWIDDDLPHRHPELATLNTENLR